MGTIGDLHALAELILESAAEALDTIPGFDAGLEGAQPRQFVSPGQPVLDCCGQLAVYVTGVGFGDTSPGGLASGKRHLHGAINHPTFQIVSSRCIPNGFNETTGQYNPPLAAVLTAAAAQLDADAWVLHNHLYHLQSSGLLLNLCDEVFFDGITAMLPSGGCAGWIAQIRAYLDGYTESFGT